MKRSPASEGERSAPQTFEGWAQDQADAGYMPGNADAFAAGVASQQAEIERLKDSLKSAKEDAEFLRFQAYAVPELKLRYEAAVEAAREFIAYVDGVNQRPMREGSMLGAATAQGKLRAALAALDDSQ